MTVLMPDLPARSTVSALRTRSRRSYRRLGVALACAAAAMAVHASAQAQAPAWSCDGHCGNLGADGVVTLAPGGGSYYSYVSTDGGLDGIGLSGIEGDGANENGSVLRSAPVAFGAGTALTFAFNFVTSDGSNYSDYAWARLLHADGTPAALLFTARTSNEFATVPGHGMPAVAATLTPASSNVNGGATTWSPLGPWSGDCYEAGCGYTGWISSRYVVATAGNYRVEVGVTNWGDDIYDSGLAFSVTDAGPLQQPPPIPEPAHWTLLLAGLTALSAIPRLRHHRGVRHGHRTQAQP